MKRIAENKDLITSSEFEADTQLILMSKMEFRHEFADIMSLIKLDYMLCVLRNIYGNKATISDPDAFKDKIKAIEKAAKQKGLNRQNSGVSQGSHFTGAKSAKSFATSENGETLGSELNDKRSTDDADSAAGSRRTRGMDKDPIYIGCQSVFEGWAAEIQEMGAQRIQYLKRTHKGGSQYKKTAADDTEVDIKGEEQPMGTIPE